MPLNNAAAAFIGASVTLVLVIIFMILMVILVRQCLAFLAKRNSIRAQTEQQIRARAEFERQRRGSITEPVPATFDWHHSIRIAGTPPPSYHEAKGLPTFEDAIARRKKKRGRRDREATDHPGANVQRAQSLSQRHQNNDCNSPEDNRERCNTAPTVDPTGGHNGSVPVVVAIENERNQQLMTSEDLQQSVTIANEGHEVISPSPELDEHIHVEMEQSSN